MLGETTVRFQQLIEDGLLEIGDGYRAKNSDLGGNGAIFLRAGQVQESGVAWQAGDRFHVHLEPRYAAKRGRPGDTIVTTKGNSVGRTAFVPRGVPEFVYSPHLSYWRSLNTQQLVPGFLRYWARSPEFIRQVRGLAHGTDMAPYLSLVDQRRLRITLPSPERQGAVADVLGALDDKIAENTQLVPTLRDAARALLVEHATPDSSFRVSDVAEIRKGLSYKGSGLADAGMPMVNLANAANHGWLKRSGFKFYTAEYKPRHVAPPGSLLLSGVDLTWKLDIIGWPMLLPEDSQEALFSQDLFMVDLLPEFRWLRLPLWAHLSTPIARARIEGMAYGTTVARIPAEAVEGLDFPAPDPDSPVLELASDLLRRAWAAERESQVLADLRDALLPPLMSGELRVREVEALVGDVL